MKVERSLSCMLLILFLLSGTLLAQTTGKIAGRVTDAASGDPLIGANIMIEGTQLGAAAGPDGSFFIINVPPGKYNLRIAMMGYETVQMQNLQVSVNRTTDVDVKMKSTVLQSDEVVVIQADRVAIKKDQTSSSRNVSSQEIAMLPVENTGDIIALQAGVVEGHFRGGRNTEVSYLLDGMAVDESFDGVGRVVDVEKEVIQDLEVITGTFNAEYGKAMSGVVNMVTKDGGNELHGSASSSFANYFTSNDNIFIGLKPGELTRQQDYKLQLDGPIWKNRISFFLNFRYENNDNHLNGIRRYNVTDYSDYANYPLDYITNASGDSSYVPLDYDENLSFMGKLSFKLSNAKLSVLYNRNDDQWMRYDHSYKYNPKGKASENRETDMVSVQLNHMFTQSAFYELKLFYKNSTYGHYLFEDYGDSRYIPFGFSRNQDFTGFYTGGQERTHDVRTIEDWNVKFDLTWQLNRTHSFKTGFQYTKMRIDNQDAEIFNVGRQFEFRPGIMSDSTLYADIYVKEPFEFSAYLQDKMEFREMVINAGVRLDYYDPTTTYPSQRRNPSNAARFDDPSKMTEPLEADPQYQVSPRLGLSYQLGETAVLHFSYGHFLQMPPKYAIYQNNSYLVSESGNTLMGNAQLKAQKTVSYEIGLWQEIIPNMSVEVALYYRDIYDLLTVNLLETYYTYRYGLYGNKDYANARGLEVKYDLLMGSFSAMANYSLQYTRGNADNPSTTFDRLGENQDPIPYLIPLEWDQRHTFNVTLGYHKKDYGTSLTVKYGSGRPFTYSPQEESPLSRVNLYPNNSIRPSTLEVDLMAQYDIKLLTNYRVRLMLNVYNLLDRLNERWVNGETGRAYTAVVRETDLAGHRSDFNDYYDRVRNPAAFYPPRLIKFGIGFYF